MGWELSGWNQEETAQIYSENRPEKEEFLTSFAIMSTHLDFNKQYEVAFFILDEYYKDHATVQFETV